MRDRVPRRDSHTDIHASVKAQRNNQCDRSECAHPSVPEQQAKYRRHIHQQNTGDRQRHDWHAVTDRGKEVLGHAANQIPKSRVPPDGHEILSNARSRAITGLLHDLSQFHVIHNLHRQPSVHAASFIRRPSKQLKSPHSDIRPRIRIGHAIRIGR